MSELTIDKDYVQGILNRDLRLNPHHLHNINTVCQKYTEMNPDFESFNIWELVDYIFESYLHGTPIDNDVGNAINFNLMARELYDSKYGFIIPSITIIDIVKGLHQPIVSVGSGVAYLEAVLKVNGVDIVATDLYPIPQYNDKPNTSQYNIFKKSIAYMSIEPLSASEAVRKYHDHAVFCCFPCYDDPWAYEMLLQMEEGQCLIYIGESKGGCNATSEFFDELYRSFVKIDDKSIIDWRGLHNRLYIFQKILVKIEQWLFEL